MVFHHFYFIHMVFMAHKEQIFETDSCLKDEHGSSLECQCHRKPPTYEFYLLLSRKTEKE